MMKKQRFFPFLFLPLFFLACQSDDMPDPSSDGPRLVVKLDVDPDQVRLGNTGQPVSVAAGNAAQDPSFNQISAHYLELAPTAWTWLGEGEVVYHAPETTVGGDNAIDFDQSILVEPGGVFLSIPLSQVQAGTYEWVRLSLSYQNFDINFRYLNIPLSGTLASFVGFNTYLTDYAIRDDLVAVNENRLQGYWGFESDYGIQTGQAPPGAITVPNPLFDTSPIPQGSCVVTGSFDQALVITGDETSDIELTLSLSINDSFEWVDGNGNGHWDVDLGEQVVDMGLRGLVPSYSK